MSVLFLFNWIILFNFKKYVSETWKKFCKSKEYVTSPIWMRPVFISLFFLHHFSFFVSKNLVVNYIQKCNKLLLSCLPYEYEYDKQISLVKLLFLVFFFFIILFFVKLLFAEWYIFFLNKCFSVVDSRFDIITCLLYKYVQIDNQMDANCLINHKVLIIGCIKTFIFKIFN